MKITDLNRDGGIGANALLVQFGDLRVLVDCGLHPKRVGRLALPDLKPLRGAPLDLIILTHCHLDHLGGLPVVMREHPNTPVIMTTSSRIIAERMLHNSASVMIRQREDANIPDYPLFTHEEVERCGKRFTGLPFGHVRHFRGAKDDIEVTFHPAGHIAGAAGIEIQYKTRKIFFTGDVLFESQRTLPGAKFPSGHFDTLVLETTRGLADREAGKERVNEIPRLIASINETIRGGGSYLVPVFALGRMQELLAILHDARRTGGLVDASIYASGLGVDLADYFDEIARKTKHIQFSRSILKELRIKSLPRQLKPGEVPEAKALYILSSGMMVERTPSYTVASGLLGKAENAIGFIGYCDPDTPGGKLLATAPGDDFLFAAADVRTKVRARIDRFDLSGHADREELLEFGVQTGARHIILTHGDPLARAWFAEQLATLAPKSKVIDPVPLETYQV